MQLTNDTWAAGDRPSALIVDDDDADRYRLTKMARRAGLDFTFHKAENLAQMRARLAERRYDIVFVDHWLGIESGQEALDLLRAHPGQADAVVIMVTSVNRHDVVIEAMRNGCDDYLVKEELGVDAIRKSVATAIERRLIQHGQRARGGRLADLEARLDRIGGECAPQMRAVLARLSRAVSRAMLQDETGRRRPDQHEMIELCLNGLTSLQEVEDACRTALAPDDAPIRAAFAQDSP